MMSRVSSSRVTRPSLSRFGRPTASKSTVTLKYEQSRLMNVRSEEHTSELQSLTNLVCRLLLENGKAHVSTIVTDQSRLISCSCFTEGDPMDDADQGMVQLMKHHDTDVVLANRLRRKHAGMPY